MLNTAAIRWTVPTYGSVEAAELGLPPGCWPEAIEVIPPGSATPVRLVRDRSFPDAADDLGGYRYGGPGTLGQRIRLTVFND